MRSARGFTLFEMLIVLLIGAIILGLGAPSFDTFRRNSRLTNAANGLLSSALLARTEAVKRQRPVSICPSADPGVAEPTCGGATFTGWIVFADTNGDCSRGGDEPLLRANGPIDPMVKASSNGTCISFGANGYIRAAGGNPSTTAILFCDPEWGTDLQPGTDQSAARSVMLGKTGRASVSRNKAMIDAEGLPCAE